MNVRSQEGEGTSKIISLFSLLPLCILFGDSSFRLVLTGEKLR